MNHSASPTQTVGERCLFKYMIYLRFQSTRLFPSWLKSGEGEIRMERVLSNVLNEKSVTTPQLSHPGTHQIVLNALIPTTVILKRNEKGKNNAV